MDTQELYREVCNNLCGLDRNKAIDTIEDMGFQCRIEKDNGESFPLTQDYQRDRINLEIEDDEVVNARFG